MAVVPEAVMRFFLTEGGVPEPGRIRGVQSQIVRGLADNKKKPGNSRFGMGSTQAEVLRIQGPPTFSSDNLWRYGSSEVYFLAGRVVGWRSSTDHSLKVR